MRVPSTETGSLDHRAARELGPVALRANGGRPARGMFEARVPEPSETARGLLGELGLGAFGAKSRSDVSLPWHVAVQETCRVVHDLPTRCLAR